MFLFDIIVLILLIVLSFGVVYLYFLMLFSGKSRKRTVLENREYNYLILIPAHNEEKVIGRTLESLKDLESCGRIEIAVIADNCSDKTSEIAKQFDISVLERNNPDEIGKGYALKWAIDKCGLDNYDAIAIIDADTIPENNILKAMADSFNGGFGAVQMYNAFSVKESSALAYLQQIANTSENIFFYKARANLGLPILLRGTGMGIRSDVLEKFPWEAFSITEDVEYSVRLLLNNIKIDFNVDSAVYSDATTSYQQAARQKGRWSSGTFELIKNRMFQLIGQGILKGRLDLIELGLSFLLLSRPLLMYTAFMAIIMAFFGSAEFFGSFILWSLVLIAMLVVYISSGVFLIPDKKAGLKALFQIPFFGFWYLFIQLKSLFKLGKMSWERTDRE